MPVNRIESATYTRHLQSRPRNWSIEYGRVGRGPFVGAGDGGMEDGTGWQLQQSPAMHPIKRKPGRWSMNLFFQR